MRLIWGVAIALVAGVTPDVLAAPKPSQSPQLQYTVTCKKTYTVVPNDVCYKIADAFGITTSQLKKWNPSINPDCTNLYIGQSLCLSPPVTNSATMPSGSKSIPSKPAKTTNVPMPTDSANTCSTNDDCPGVYCCNLFTNQCVLDPKGNICDIQPTTRVTSKTMSNGKPTVTHVTSKVPRPSTTPAPSYPTGLTVAVESQQDFCLFLPRSPGNKDDHGGKVDPDAIADSEKNAVAFCTRPNVNAPGSGLLPRGFIKSAKFQQNTAAGFVQVTGKIDRSKYSLSSQDGGGQYDNHGAGSPPHSACKGYPYYVSLIEPDINGFCIRCCQSYKDCNAGRSAYGCHRVVPPL
ncbi:uncharacterized protein BYT42DRAFT_579575 [Radiomyces spectabilis]|uniref:uncharacterized protein n=1 Tax=Radiomyces spectabilis TaxID=64574 RepID=UPI00221EC123|nr:uncharacterized protein BYT42DRAFT_579575 [Radiomyces spectabilis]KAI8373204.1 hypothetical protein BYT42DRAFT_579575 [Radiomyces spectabilis]